MRRSGRIGGITRAAVGVLLLGAAGCASSNTGFTDGGDKDIDVYIPPIPVPDSGTRHDATSDGATKPDAISITTPDTGTQHDATGAGETGTGTNGDGGSMESGSPSEAGSQGDAMALVDGSAHDGSAHEDGSEHADGAAHEEASVEGGAHPDGGTHKDAGSPDAAAACTVSTECPATGTTCVIATCTNDLCGTMDATKGTTCNDHGGSTCDGAGHCGLAAQGATCTTNTTCASDHCVDGFCCDTACTGTCQACNAAQTGGANGTCEDVLAGNPAPAGQCTASACGNAGTCSAGACEQVAAGTVCGAAATCAMGTETSAGACSSGACVAGQSSSCGAYTCNVSATACLVHCSANTDCSEAADYCANPGTTTGTCVPKLAVGTACTAGAQCVSGDCYGAPEVCQANLCGDGVKDGQETGVDCGGPTCTLCPTVLLVGAGASSSVGAELHPTTGANGTWSATTALNAPSVDDLGIAFSGTGAATSGVSVMRYTEMGAALDQSLVYATWAPGATTLAGTWVPFAAVAAGVTTLDVPAIAATSTTNTTFVSFLGTDYKQYFTSYSAGTWSPAEAVTPAGGIQASGPTPAGIAAIGANATIAYFLNGSNQATAQNRTTAWQPPVTLDATAADESYVSTPAIVAMNGGTSELLTVFVRQTDGALVYAKRTAGTWSATALVPGATAPASTSAVERVGLAALPSGNAIVAWQDRTTSGIFYSLYAAGTWSAAPLAFATPNITVGATPSVTHGVAGATAEMAFVESSGVAFHTRLVNGAWTSPVSVGGTSLSHVTITSAP